MQNGCSLGTKIEHLTNVVIQEDDAGWTDLHECASTGDEEKLQLLLASGAIRTAKESQHGNTPLHEAAWRGYSRCVKLLCAPIHPKKTFKDKKLKEILHETRDVIHSGLLGIRNNGGFSALHLSAQKGHNQSCREILLSGGDADVQNNFGDTALHTACRYGHAGAARILLSASCDPNKTNLNGDTPLHITCAMSRRKLTRILLEGGSNVDVKNAQNETPRDIALRKNYAEIINILDNPQHNRHRRERKKNAVTDANRHKLIKGLDNVGNVNEISWSPYGCHYFPDPRAFPSPKLETLPTEPLKKGEQYYLDLAGNIRKGPVGVGNTCYCGPFMKHIEDRINRNRKSLRMFVHKATERLDSKMQAIATRADDQIEKLTRSMMADRIRCESRRLQMEHWLRRGEPMRLTADEKFRLRPASHDGSTILPKSRSLEMIDSKTFSQQMLSNSRSFDCLGDSEVLVHAVKNAEDHDMEDDMHDRDSVQSSLSVRDGICNYQGVFRRMGGMDEVDDDGDGDGGGDVGNRKCIVGNVSERVESLLTKTDEILEMDNFNYKNDDGRQQREGVAMNFVTKTTTTTTTTTTSATATITTTTAAAPAAITYDDCMAMASRRQQRSSLDLDNVSRHISFEKEATHSESSAISNLSYTMTMRANEKHDEDTFKDENHNFRYGSGGHCTFEGGDLKAPTNERMVQLLMEADLLNRMKKTRIKLRHEDYNNIQPRREGDDHHHRTNNTTTTTTTTTTTITTTATTSTTSTVDGVADCEMQKTTTTATFMTTDKVAMKSIRDITEMRLNNDEEMRATRCMAALSTDVQRMDGSDCLDNPEKSVSGTIKKIEIKNSEIKSLKNRSASAGIIKRNKVQELVSRLQGKLSSTQKFMTRRDDTPAAVEKSELERSEKMPCKKYNLNVISKLQGALPSAQHASVLCIPVAKNTVSVSSSPSQQPHQQQQQQQHHANNVEKMLTHRPPLETYKTATLYESQLSSLVQDQLHVNQHCEENRANNVIFNELLNTAVDTMDVIQALNVPAGQRDSNMYVQQQQQQQQHRQGHIGVETTLPMVSSLPLPHSIYENMPPLMGQQTSLSTQRPPIIRRKLLSNRKIPTAPNNVAANRQTTPPFTYELNLLKGCTYLEQQQQQQLQQQAHNNIPPDIFPCVNAPLSSPDQQIVVERDISNDSGISTIIYAKTDGHQRSTHTRDIISSPTTTTAIHYASSANNVASNGNDITSTKQFMDNNAANFPYYIGNTSSLV